MPESSPPDETRSPGASAAQNGHSPPQSTSDGHAETDDASGDETLSNSGGTLSWKQILWPLLLSALALGAVAAFTFEPGAFWTFARRANPLLLGVASLITGLRIFFGGWRLQFVSHGRLGLAEGVRGQLAWDFLSNLTPTALGGGPVAIVYLARDQDIPVGEASAFMLFSIMLDQIWFAFSIPLLLGASVFFEVFPDSVGGIGHGAFFAVFAGLVGWAVLFTYAVLFRPDLLQRLAHRVFSVRLLRRFRKRVVREATHFAERARLMRGEPFSFYAKSFLLTAGTWLGRYLLAVVIIWSVYPALDVGLAALRSVALTLSGLVMPTPGGAGGLEGLYALFFGPLMPEALMAPTLLVWRFLGYYVFIALGAYLSVHQARQELQRYGE